MTNLIPQWRAHHILLCSSTYFGKGYTPSYTANLNAMLSHISGQPEGTEVKLVSEPDDWCKPLLLGTDEYSLIQKKHCLHRSTVERDTRAIEDLSQLLGKKITPSTTLLVTPALIKEFRTAFRRSTRTKQTAATTDYASPRRGCYACPWQSLCDEVAQRHFPDVKLFPEATPRQIVPIKSLVKHKAL